MGLEEILLPIISVPTYVIYHNIFYFEKVINLLDIECIIECIIFILHIYNELLIV